MDVISFPPIVVHEFIFNVLRLALEVVPVVQQRSGAEREGPGIFVAAERKRE